MSKLYFYFGTMSSGKSLLLLAKAHNFQERGIPFMCLKSTIDTRDNANEICSRGLPSRSCIGVTPETDIYSAVQKYLDLINDTYENAPQWILVDESQFLSEEQIDQLSKIVDDLNINVMCYGLRTDFQTKLFTGSKRLFELADTIEEIKSTCSCGHKNLVNARINHFGEVITEGEQVMVGGNDQYISMCRKCYNKQKKN